MPASGCRPSWNAPAISADVHRPAPIQIYDPFNADPAAQRLAFVAQFPGNRIPTSGFNPVSVKAISYYPAPNSRASSGTRRKLRGLQDAGFRYRTRRSQDRSKLSENKHLMGKYSRYFASRSGPELLQQRRQRRRFAAHIDAKRRVDYTQTWVRRWSSMPRGS
jgi:hypothetical protein